MKYYKPLFFLFCILTFCSCGKSNVHTNSNITAFKVANIASEEATISKDEGSIEIDCSEEGNATTDAIKALNILKNRSGFPLATDFNAQITLISLLEKGDDINRWSNKKAGKIIGYVKEVKVGSIETANCKATEKDLRDTHIELVLNPNSYEKNNCVVIEVTPRLRKMMAEKGIDWSTLMLRSKYLGRWVEVEGWLFFDSEHTNKAENTNPGNLTNWRGTAWEIHPVTSIKIAEKH